MKTNYIHLQIKPRLLLSTTNKHVLANTTACALHHNSLCSLTMTGVKMHFVIQMGYKAQLQSHLLLALKQANGNILYLQDFQSRKFIYNILINTWKTTWNLMQVWSCLRNNYTNFNRYSNITTSVEDVQH